MALQDGETLVEHSAALWANSLTRLEHHANDITFNRLPIEGILMRLIYRKKCHEEIVPI